MRVSRRAKKAAIRGNDPVALRQHARAAASNAAHTQLRVCPPPPPRVSRHMPWGWVAVRPGRVDPPRCGARSRPCACDPTDTSRARRGGGGANPRGGAAPATQPPPPKEGRIAPSPPLSSQTTPGPTGRASAASVLSPLKEWCATFWEYLFCVATPGGPMAWAYTGSIAEAVHGLGMRDPPRRRAWFTILDTCLHPVGPKYLYCHQMTTQADPTGGKSRIFGGNFHKTAQTTAISELSAGPRPGLHRPSSHHVGPHGYQSTCIFSDNRDVLCGSPHQAIALQSAERRSMGGWPSFL